MPEPVVPPLALYQANLELVLRLEQLRQQAGRYWLAFGSQAMQQGMAEARTEGEQLGKASGNLQALAALPAEAFWRQMQLQFGQAQAAAEQAAQAQAEFAAGLQDAVQRWHQQAAPALEPAASAAGPAAQAMQDFLAPWKAWMPAARGRQ